MSEQMEKKIPVFPACITPSEVSHGALAMTTPGDTTMASKKEVEAIMGGADARIQR